MRVHRTYSIEQEYIDKLKDVNASQLINELLAEHFRTSESTKTEIETYEGRIEQLERAKTELLEKQETIDREKNIVKSLNYPKETIEWLKMKTEKPGLWECVNYLKAKKLPHGPQDRENLIAAWTLLH